MGIRMSIARCCCAIAECAKCYYGAFTSLSIGGDLDTLPAYDSLGTSATKTAAGEVTGNSMALKWGTDIDLNAGNDGLPVFPVFPEVAKFTLNVLDADLSSFIQASNDGNLTSSSQAFFAWNIGGNSGQSPTLFQGLSVEANVQFSGISGNYEIFSWKVNLNRLNSVGGTTTAILTTLSNADVEAYIEADWEWEMWFPQDVAFGTAGDNVKFFWKLYRDGVQVTRDTGDSLGNYSLWVLSNPTTPDIPQATKWCSQPRSMAVIESNETAYPVDMTIGPMSADLGDDSCFPAP